MTNERIIVLGNDDNITVGTLHMNKMDITRSTVFEAGSIPELAINKKLLDRIDILEKKIERMEGKIPDGHNTVFCGEEPDKFKEGDLWYGKNGSYSVARWINHELKMDPIFVSEQ